MKIKIKKNVVQKKLVNLYLGARFRLGQWTYIFGSSDADTYGLVNIDTGSPYCSHYNKIPKLQPSNLSQVFGGDVDKFEFFNPETKDWVKVSNLKSGGDDSFYLSEDKEVEEKVNISIRIGSFIEMGENKYIITQNNTGGTALLIDLGNGLCYGETTYKNAGALKDEELRNLFHLYQHKTIKIHHEGEYYPLTF